MQKSLDRRREAVCSALAVACLLLPAAAGAAPILSNPAFTVTPTPTGFILFKDLTAFNAYGTPGTDILYTGTSGTWTFDLTGVVNPSDVTSAFFRTSLAADDHFTTPLSAYMLSVTVNGTAGYSGLAGVPHGISSSFPFGAFTNFAQRDDPLGSVMLVNTLGLANTSVFPTNAGDWLAVDWIELHLTTSTEAPEPATLLLVGVGIAAAASRRRTGRRRDDRAARL
jgi:hypothetical protein